MVATDVRFIPALSNIHSDPSCVQRCMLPVHTKMFEVVLGRSCEASTPADWPTQPKIPWRNQPVDESAIVSWGIFEKGQIWVRLSRGFQRFFWLRQATMSWTTPVKPSPPSGKSSLKGPFWVSWLAWNGTNMNQWDGDYDDMMTWLVCCQLSNIS